SSLKRPHATPLSSQAGDDAIRLPRPCQGTTFSDLFPDVGPLEQRSPGEAAMRLRFPLAIVAITILATAADAAEQVDPPRNAFVATNDPLGESIDKVVYLAQNWSPQESLQFYFTPQGSQIIPYDWFLVLEQPDSSTLFRDYQNILKYRYLAQEPGPQNPDG